MKNILWDVLKLFLGLIIFPLGAEAQDLPKIIQPSPSTAALFRFQDYPMDFSTGLPQINIPIYEVKSGSLSVPISISYHASGRRVYDQDGPVALGWSLNAGGMISRTIYGDADFGTLLANYLFPYPFKVDNIDLLNDLEYLEKIMHYSNPNATHILPWLDSQYDVFSYSFSNNSGKFIFRDNNNVKTPVLLPYKPFQINITTTTNELLKIEITDDKGVLYEFIKGETYSVSSDNATSAWVLTKIISADKADTILFTYEGGVEKRVSINRTAILDDSWSNDQLMTTGENPRYIENKSNEFYQIQRLSQITFKQGKVLFNQTPGTTKLNNIQIVDNNNEVLKTIQFQRSLCYIQALLETTTNKLDAIIFKDKDGNSIENYSFEYYPVVSGDGQLDPHYCDWWGYYNNSGQIETIPYYSNVPFETWQGGTSNIPISSPSVYREPNLEALKSGVLKKITYPTGGNTEFLYQHNQCTLYGASGAPVNGPGLRVYQIITTEVTGISSFKTFKYGLDENGYGSIEMLPEMSNMSSELIIGYVSGIEWLPQPSGRYRQRTFYSNFIPELSALAERPVIYTEVAEYNGTETNNIGKSVYNYDNYQWAPAGMPIAYSALIGKKHISNFNYWNNPSLVKRVDFKRLVTNGVITYQPVKSTDNYYSVNITENIRGLHVQRNYLTPSTGVWGPENYWSEKFIMNEGAGNPYPAVAPQVYTFSGYDVPAGYKNLTNTTEALYNADGSIITNDIAYTYNSRQYVSKTTTTASDGSSISSDIKYPFDYTGNSILNLMIGLNMLRHPVERIESKNTNTPIKAVRTNYANFGGTPARIYPQTVEVKQGNNSYETLLRYHAYDAAGNILTVSKEKDVLKTYIWGYDKSYPVAEVTGVDHATILSTVLSLNQSVLNNPSSDQALRDEIQKIRIAIPSAQVSGYTYKPLIGMTTQTDVNGKTMYYEYDGFGRLKLIRDMDNNIVKTFKYKYQSPTP